MDKAQEEKTGKVGGYAPEPTAETEKKSRYRCAVEKDEKHLHPKQDTLPEMMAVHDVRAFGSSKYE